MQIARTLASPTRVALYGGIGNETPWGVEADELFQKPAKKGAVAKTKAAILNPLLQDESEPVTSVEEPPTPITD